MPRKVSTSARLKLARHLDPNGVIPKYNLQYLRYFLGIQIQATAHDALGDILVLKKLFERLFARMSKGVSSDGIEDKMIEISSNPVLLNRMYFGKHKGELFRDIPIDYLAWLAGKDNLDEDMRYTVNHYFNA